MRRNTIGVLAMAMLLALGLTTPALATQSGTPPVTCQGDNAPVDVYDGDTKVGSLLWDNPGTGQVTFDALEGFENYEVELCINGSTDVFEATLGDGEASRAAQNNGNNGNGAAVSNVKILRVVPPAVTDVCPNIDGNQETVPDGMVLEDGDCIDPDTIDPDNTCVTYAGKDAVENYNVDAGTATATIAEDACDAVTLTLSSYELPGGTALPYEDQVHFENDTQTLEPGETGNFAVGLPECNWQTDLYTGEKITELIPGVGHPANRLLEWDLNEGNTCEEDGVIGDGTPAVDITTTNECGVATITVTTTDIPDHWQYGVTVEVDGEFHERNLVKGVGTDTITVELDEDASDGEALVTYNVTDATEWDLIDESLQASAPLTLNVDTDCEDDGAIGDGDDTIEKVEICHATASPKNPYVLIEPAVEGVLTGHADQHNGPIYDEGMDNGDWGDIIPAFNYVDDNGDVQQFAGQNWDALGQSVYDDGCAVGDLEAANPAISIDKSADVDTVTLTGDDDTAEVTYTYEITNTGTIILDLTELSDDKIADLDVSDVDDTMLDVGETTTATQVVDLGADDFDEDGEHTNVATVTAVIEGGDVDGTDDTVTDTDDETVTVVIDDDDTVGDGVASVDITGEKECGVATITVTSTNVPSNWQYGVTVLVDGEIRSSNVVEGTDSDTITVNLDEDASDGEAVVTYYVSDATEWDLIPEDLDGQYAEAPVIRTLYVDTDCDKDDGNGVPPVVVQPDIEDDGPLRICVGTDATLILEAMFDDLETAEDFDFGDLELALDAADLDLEAYGLDSDDLVFDEDGNFSTTLTNLPIGVHEISYTVTLDDETVESGDIEVRVTVCPPFPEIPVDGDEGDEGNEGNDGDEGDGGTPVVDVPTIAVDYNAVCPDGVAGFTVNATGTDLDTNDAEILVAYDAASAPYWSGDITLGEELALRWPVDADGNELDEFVFWVSVDGVTSDLVMVDDNELECVLGEVIDRPDVDDNDDDETPVRDDGVIEEDDEAVREDDQVVTDDDEDEVLGVVYDDSDDEAVAGEELAYTGSSVLALLAAGLLSLLTGAGLLRRRS